MHPIRQCITYPALVADFAGGVLVDCGNQQPINSDFDIPKGLKFSKVNLDSGSAEGEAGRRSCCLRVMLRVEIHTRLGMIQPPSVTDAVIIVIVGANSSRQRGIGWGRSFTWGEGDGGCGRR